MKKNFLLFLQNKFAFEALDSHRIFYIGTLKCNVCLIISWDAFVGFFDRIKI